MIGKEGGIWILNSAIVRLVNVAVSASVRSDSVNTSAQPCHGCNVMLGSLNAALVVDNSFWLWVERGSFSGPDASGQRPSVILRGRSEFSAPLTPVHAVYQVRFERCVFGEHAHAHVQTT